MKKKENYNTDILIIGCGIAGLAASQIFSNLGYKCINVDRMKRNLSPMNKFDYRSTAFLNNSIKVFQKSGIWEDLKKISQPLKKMDIFCLKNEKITEQGSFKPQEIGDEEFGFNLPNHETKEIIISKLKKNKNVELIFNKSIEKILFRTFENISFFSENLIVKSKLIIAADGFNSKVREICELTHKTNFFDQKALAFSVYHKKPHENASYEFYKDTGSLTLVPLKNKNKSAVVLMDKTKKINDLIKFKKNHFDKELKKRTNNIRGELNLVTKFDSYPIKSHYINQLNSHRVAFIGESAHSMPPIGAQGLNTSFSDILELEEIFKCKNNVHEFSLCEKNLKKYNKLRLPLIVTTINAINAFNWAVRTKNENIQFLRNRILNLLNNDKNLKSIVMKLGSQNFLPLSK